MINAKHIKNFLRMFKMGRYNAYPIFGISNLIYIMYLLFVNKQYRTLCNILLFTIIIGISTVIHQIINIRDQKTTSYL